MVWSVVGCVCERERERERDSLSLCVYVCVCVCRQVIGHWLMLWLMRSPTAGREIWSPTPHLKTSGIYCYSCCVHSMIHCTVQCIPIQCYHLTADQNMLWVKDIQLWERTDLPTSCKSNKKELVYQICKILSRTDWLSLTFL